MVLVVEMEEGVGRKGEELSWGSTMVEAGLVTSSSLLAAVRAVALELGSKGGSLAERDEKEPLLTGRGRDDRLSDTVPKIPFLSG